LCEPRRCFSFVSCRLDPTFGDQFVYYAFAGWNELLEELLGLSNDSIVAADQEACSVRLDGENIAGFEPQFAASRNGHDDPSIVTQSDMID